MAKKIRIGSIGAAASLGAHLVPAVKAVAPSVSLGKAAAPAIHAVASAASTGTTSNAPSLAAAKRAQAKTAERQRQKRVKQAKSKIGEQRRKLRKDTAKPKKVAVAVPTFVPKKYRKTVALQGQMIPAKGTGLTGPEYLAGTDQFESGFDPHNVNPTSGAYGIGQFMKGTADTFRSTYGVDPTGKPKQQIKASAMHLSGKFGHPALYAGYNPGYGSDPVPGVVAGTPEVKVKVSAKRAKKIAGGKVSTGSVPKPLPGAWEGSKKAVLSKIPHIERAEGRGDKRTPAYNASVGGSPTSDHLTTNKSAYAADIPVNANVYHAIQKKLGLPQTATGEQTITKDGYRYQLIYGAQYGHGDHIHLGAEYVGTGDTAVSGTSSTYGGSSAVSGTGGTGGGYSATPASGHGSVASRKRGSRSHRRDVAARKGRKKATRLISHYRSNLTKGGEAKPAVFTPTSRTRKLVKLT